MRSMGGDEHPDEVGCFTSSPSWWRAWDGGEEGDPGAGFQRGGSTLVSCLCPKGGSPPLPGDRACPQPSPPAPEPGQGAPLWTRSLVRGWARCFLSSFDSPRPANARPAQPKPHGLFTRCRLFLFPALKKSWAGWVGKAPETEGAGWHGLPPLIPWSWAITAPAPLLRVAGTGQGPGTPWADGGGQEKRWGKGWWSPCWELGTPRDPVAGGDALHPNAGSLPWWGGWGERTSVPGGLRQRLQAGRSGGSPRPWLMPGSVLGVLEQLLVTASAASPEVEVGEQGTSPSCPASPVLLGKLWLSWHPGAVGDPPRQTPAPGWPPARTRSPRQDACRGVGGCSRAFPGGSHRGKGPPGRRGGQGVGWQRVALCRAVTLGALKTLLIWGRGAPSKAGEPLNLKHQIWVPHSEGAPWRRNGASAC